MKIKSPKKLIEVALPLDDINAASSREKSIRHGHPSTLHLWWARRPLAAARAVLFAQLVNDPGYDRSLQFGVNKEKAQAERERLFDIIRKLVQWENTNNEEVLTECRAEIRKSWREVCELNKNHPQAAELFNPDKLPGFHDPFAGGGAIPLEAQRLGIEAYASDLNPVAVLINKAMIEIPPRFAGHKPIGPIPEGEKQMAMHEEWPGAKGLAEDVRRYGHWMQQEAEKRIGHLYPTIEITAELAQERKDLKPLIGQKLTVIAWLWARTVKSPNPAFSHVDVPLASTFMLSTKPGKEAYVEPVVEGDKYRFVVKTGKPRNTEQVKNGTKAGARAQFRCLLSNTPIDGGYIKSEGQAGRIGARLMGIVAEGVKGRIYFSPTKEHELIAQQATPEWRPGIEFAKNSRHMTPWVYGLSKFGDLFTSRQLAALTTFSDLAQEARELVCHDALVSGMPNGDALDAGGSGAQAYADAVSVYLGFAIDRLAMTGNSLVRWNGVGEKAQHCFGRQALPMIWDYAEPNFLAEATGSLSSAVFYSYDPIPYLPAYPAGSAGQADAQSQVLSGSKIVSTDPPYYDNVPYADLSDFFYVWLRRSLRQIFPNLFATLAVPKAEELVADAYRQGNKEVAEEFFLGGMTAAIHRLVEQAHPASPITIYYAFKQSETQSNSTASTGWETFLEAIIGSSLAITGTWPLRTEMATRMRGMDSNALASSILLVCRQRAKDEQTISRREFQRELKEALPEALDVMIGGKDGISPVAPVDLAQAAIGPGMAVFSQYAAVLEADGSSMSVHTALTLINKAIDEYFSEAEGELDVDSRFCVQWFEESGWNAGQFGQADVLARAKGTSVDAVRDAGVIESGSGKVRLLRFAEYPPDWSPDDDNRTPVWEALHHMIRVLQNKDEGAAGSLLARMPARADAMRQLAYRLYTMCERKGWAEDARAYNELITSWRPIEAASHDVGHIYTQQELLG
jgi:putative DNA methylase